MQVRRLCTASGCNKIVLINPDARESPRCEKHKTPPLEMTPIRDGEWYQKRKFYGSTQWKKVREQKIRQQPLCEHCLKMDMIVPADDVDHIVEIKDGGDKFAMDNLQSLCRHHHLKKTARERKKRETKKALNGFSSLSDF